MGTESNTPVRDHLEPGELESISQLNVRVPRSLHKALKAQAQRRGVFLEGYIETVLRDGYQRDVSKTFLKKKRAA
jgi:predicted HicB family RNase H-like nuclease